MAIETLVFKLNRRLRPAQHRFRRPGRFWGMILAVSPNQKTTREADAIGLPWISGLFGGESMRRATLVVLPLLLATALPAAGQVATVNGNSISITISRLGVSVDLTLTFEDVTALSLANLGLSAQLVNPLDPALRARLPQGTTVALPLLLRLEPPVSGGLSFRGVTTIDIHTQNLVY